MKYKTTGKGEWHIVKLTPSQVLEMASTVTLQMSKSERVDNCYWNQTLDGKFRIMVSQ
jgi:hypothetical protein